MEHPLLCNSQVVRNILDRRQTQDRRPIKPQPTLFDNAGMPDFSTITDPKKKWQPGDVLVVREAWWAVEVTDIGIQYCVFDDEIIDGIPTPKELRLLDRQTWRWGRHPSIHMPMKHSRLRLTVKRVWVERIQDISEADAKAEGAEPENAEVNFPGGAYQNGFFDLWNSIYGPAAWDRNDWVFATEFEVGQ